MFNEIFRIVGKLDGVNSMVAGAIGADFAAQLSNPKTAIAALSGMMSEMQKSMASMKSQSALASVAFGQPASSTTASSPSQGAGFTQLLQYVTQAQQLRRLSVLLEVVQLKVRLRELETELDRMALNPNAQLAMPTPMSVGELLDQLKVATPPAPPSFTREMSSLTQMMNEVQGLQDLLTQMLESYHESAKAAVRNMR